MFDKKKDLSAGSVNDMNTVFRPAKGSSKVVIGEGVNIKGEITNADDVQIDGTADITLKTSNLTVGAKGILSGTIEASNADIWGKVEGDLKISNTLTVQELGAVSGKIEYENLQIKLGGNITGDLIKSDNSKNKTMKENKDESTVSLQGSVDKN